MAAWKQSVPMDYDCTLQRCAIDRQTYKVPRSAARAEQQNLMA